MAIALGGVVLTIGLLNTIEITYQMLYDSRYAAAQWLAAHTEPGHSVEFFGAVSNLPALKAGVNTRLATEFRGMYVKPQLDEAKVQEILSSWRTRQPDFIIIMPDYTNHQPIPYSHTVPPQLYQGLLNEAYEYRLAAYFETAALFPWLRKPLLDYPTVNPPIRIFRPKNVVSAHTDGH
jgi:hypothetical protein